MRECHLSPVSYRNSQLGNAPHGCQQYDFTIIVHGQQNWFDLSYVNREKEFTAEMRQRWLTIFSNSTLKTATAVTPG